MKTTCTPHLTHHTSYVTRPHMEHEGVFFEVGRQGGALMGAFIWRTNRGQGCGGIRSREYPSAREWLRDGLRLATGMGRKNALAGLFWGGAKGVVAQPPPSEFPLTPQTREAIFADYGRFLTSLRGCYVAAEDSGALAPLIALQPWCSRSCAGVTVKDVDAVFSKTRHTTCISPSLGGSGNPSVITARGIVCAIQVRACCLLHRQRPSEPLSAPSLTCVHASAPHAKAGGCGISG